MSILANKIQHVVINRTDAMGDVILTLPACIYLKSLFPHLTITFLGRNYTKAIIECCPAIDHFINYDELKLLPEQEQVNTLREKNIDAIVHIFSHKPTAILARKAGINIRIGSSSKFYNWFNCNRLIKLSRKNSPLNEAQLNIYLLKELGVTHIPSLAEIAALYPDNFKPRAELNEELKSKLDKTKFNLIIHPKSHGHGCEWDMENFTKLIWQLPAEKFNIMITGSQKEHELFKEWIPKLPDHVTDMSGTMGMADLISFVFHCDGLLASGTGPLHLAAASGIHTLGLFPLTRSINAKRWGPVGIKAEYMESDGDDLGSISVDMVYNKINAWLAE